MATIGAATGRHSPKARPRVILRFLQASAPSLK